MVSPRRHRHARLLALLASALPGVAAPLHAQRAAPPASAAVGAPSGPLWDSYRRAAEILSAAVAAHGGAPAHTALSALTFRWAGEDFAPTQGRVPVTGREWEVNARPASQRVAIDYPRERVLVDLDFAFGGGYRNAVRVVGTPRSFLVLDPTGAFNGTTFSRDTTGAGHRRSVSTYERQMPALLLRRALGRMETLRFVGERVAAGRRELGISFTDTDGAVVTLYMDAATRLVVAREDAGVGSLGDEVDAWRWSDHAPSGDLVVPRRMEITWNGYRAGTRRLTEFAREAGIADSLLQPPAGYLAAPPALPLAMRQVADGIWFVERIGGGYRSLVVDTDQGVVMVDAPVGVGATQAAIALVERTLPGRPIAYVAVTHHHADHIAGLPAFVARGTTILAAAGSEGYLRRMVAVPRTIGRLLPVPRDTASPPRIEAVAGRRVIGTGDRRVELIDAGPTSHASAMLVAWVPSQRLLFQGDLLRVNEIGGPASSPAATRDLAALIRRLALPVATIAAVHGRNATMAELEAVLARDGRVPTP